MAQTTEQYPQDGILFMRRALLVAAILLGLFLLAAVYAALLASGVLVAGAIVIELPDEDEAHDRSVQDKVDAETQREIEEKRRAAGNSPEQMAIQDAFIEGGRAGAQGVAAGLNPNQHGTPEYDAWERGRSGAEIHRLRRVASR